MSQFDRDLEIDPDALDVELVKQPGLVAKYAHLEADARTNLARAKDQLSLVEAQLYSKAKGVLMEGGTKPTESAINAWVIVQRTRVDAQNTLTDWQEKCNTYAAALKALDHKKSALERLVQLLMADYFAKPKEARDLGDACRTHVRIERAAETKATKEKAVAAMSRRTKPPVSQEDE